MLWKNIFSAITKLIFYKIYFCFTALEFCWSKLGWLANLLDKYCNFNVCFDFKFSFFLPFLSLARLVMAILTCTTTYPAHWVAPSRWSSSSSESLPGTSRCRHRPPSPTELLTGPASCSVGYCAGSGQRSSGQCKARQQSASAAWQLLQHLQRRRRCDRCCAVAVHFQQPALRMTFDLQQKMTSLSRRRCRRASR